MNVNEHVNVTQSMKDLLTMLRNSTITVRVPHAERIGEAIQNAQKIVSRLECADLQVSAKVKPDSPETPNG